MFTAFELVQSSFNCAGFNFLYLPAFPMTFHWGMAVMSRNTVTVLLERAQRRKEQEVTSSYKAGGSWRTRQELAVGRDYECEGWKPVHLVRSSCVSSPWKELMKLLQMLEIICWMLHCREC